ncbi:Hypothetical_protein [Hexamita inflata]|uniref:Hypothetical_protein n=1 Tax=Hexamita inflata TaxID=28002 RepID=A0AA86UJL8_9EUKA|nr:Hypothetical protein HINF_LOCUS48465 [Hexamita inflata]
MQLLDFPQIVKIVFLGSSQGQGISIWIQIARSQHLRLTEAILGVVTTVHASKYLVQQNHLMFSISKVMTIQPSLKTKENQPSSTSRLLYLNNSKAITVSLCYYYFKSIKIFRQVRFV